ncbi:hypothetical protein ONE63_009386 [Megalurothrips usitatus]|uniref:Homeobox domain-containing protein n=1 Tax=Megalurothrips usitatus TaxID=439358 RepID=A0AAV7XR27_9NEOP|nr:hypothetical protein ONE63_009386 [Megalurothrips usitatus]
MTVAASSVLDPAVGREAPPPPAAAAATEAAGRPHPQEPQEPPRGVDEAAPGWCLRSRRHRLSTRPAKRLFTPDIKKLLKGWLVRRRDNPYPSRAEKEALAARTGLTHMQVCNWFANWRRKLRDCAAPEDGVEDEGGSRGSTEGGGGTGGGSWAHLIRRYNALAAAPNSSTAQEHFSISSSDSIWAADEHGGWAAPHGKRRWQPPGEECPGSALLLGRWLESAARYQPPPATAAAAAKAAAGWGTASMAREAVTMCCGVAGAAVEHTLEGRHREELDAAEALAFLSSLHFR